MTPPSEEVAHGDEEAVAVPPAAPESVGLSGHEVQSGLDVERVGDAMVALELDVVARRDSQVGGRAQLQRGVLGELGVDAAYERVAEAAVREQVANKRRVLLVHDAGMTDPAQYRL